MIIAKPTFVIAASHSWPTARRAASECASAGAVKGEMSTVGTAVSKEAILGVDVKRCDQSNNKGCEHAAFTRTHAAVASGSKTLASCTLLLFQQAKLHAAVLYVRQKLPCGDSF